MRTSGSRRTGVAPFRVGRGPGKRTPLGGRRPRCAVKHLPSSVSRALLCSCRTSRRWSGGPAADRRLDGVAFGYFLESIGRDRRQGAERMAIGC